AGRIRPACRIDRDQPHAERHRHPPGRRDPDAAEVKGGGIRGSGHESEGCDREITFCRRESNPPAPTNPYIKKGVVAMPRYRWETEEHDLFRESLRKFLEKEAVPHYEQWEQDRLI